MQTQLTITADDIRKLSRPDRQAFLAEISADPDLALRFPKNWEFWARPSQRIPQGDWDSWVINAGRGFGKTKTGAETVRTWVKQGFTRIALIGADAEDVRKVMVLGDSGVISACCEFDETDAGEHIGRPSFNPSLKTLTWANGAEAHLYSGEDPDALRGPQHEKAWVDEFAKMKRAKEMRDQLEFGLRLGSSPQALYTTTPRPTAEMVALLEEKSAVVTTGSTFDNAANLSSKFLERLQEKYAGTRLGDQELYAKVLTDVAGALFPGDVIDATRIKSPPEMARIVVGVDPSGARNGTGDSDIRDLIGISVCGLGTDGHLYVLEDLSIGAGPTVWGSIAVQAYHKWGADHVIGESNFGGGMVEHVIQTADRGVPFKMVTASRGKHIRAEPIASLFEQERAHIVGSLPDLEAQLKLFTPRGYEGGTSPDNADAMIHAASELMLNQKAAVDFWV